MIQNRSLDFLGTYSNSIKSTAQVISLCAPSLVWNSQIDLRLQRKGLCSVRIAYARFLVSRKSLIHSWHPSIWNSHVETHEGTTGWVLAANAKIDVYRHLLQAGWDDAPGVQAGEVAGGLRASRWCSRGDQENGPYALWKELTGHL